MRVRFPQSSRHGQKIIIAWRNHGLATSGKIKDSCQPPLTSTKTQLCLTLLKAVGRRNGREESAWSYTEDQIPLQQV